ncbi:MAG TPA: nitrate ABC transporter ATP-binding protein [Nitrospinae bacterium]|nr:nitrate ABC transporter ATP-binding protein [Nitrospinota bacterium]
MPAKVSIKNLTMEYMLKDRVVTALKGINLEIADGEFLCVVGLSGCGKTTLLNILGGFFEHTQGEILLDGKPINEVGGEMNRGVVFQEYALFPWRTALKNVEFGLEMKGMEPKEREETAQKYIELVHLEKFAHLYPHNLSGGMKQRVAVARAYAYEPEFLLMDEPFGALDAQTRENLQEMTIEVWQKTKKTIFYVTHNLSEAVYLADRIIVLAGQPGVIHKEIRIDLPRSRDLFDPKVVDLIHMCTEAVRGN